MELIESFLSGTPGPLVHFILYIICTTLYLAVMVLAYTGTTLIVEHLGYELEEKRRWLLRCPIYYGCVVDCVK
ncbi:MAG: hypothetical protein Q4B60_09425 [Erysipelotrichaceae bacterium]|nr:hypothetical protein [Erysipelotrichaceae bacterium]